MASLAVVAAFSLAPIYLAGRYEADQRHALAVEAERHLTSRIGHAQLLLDRAKSIPDIVALTISQADSPARFEAAVRNILAMSGIVESVSIASTRGPATVVYRDPREQKRTNSVALQSMTPLQMDKKLFIGFGDGTLMIRDSLSERDASGRAKFWGYLTAEASFADLIQELQLLSLVNEGFGVHFAVQWQSGVAETVIFRGGEIGRDGTAKTLPLPGNAQLLLKVAPPAAAPVVLQPMTLVGLVGAGILLFLLTYHLLRRPAVLERQVEARTREIAAEKVALKSEIEARISAESFLERSYALLDSIFEHIPGMIVLKRVSDLRIARINSSGEQMLGRSRDLLCGRSNEEIFAPAIADVLSHSDSQVLEQPGLVKLPLQRIEMPGAAPRWIAFSKTALRDRNGVPQYILEFGEDLTEREALSRKLTEQLHFLEQLVEAFPGPVFSKDLDGRYLVVNARFERMIGRPRSELLGKTVVDIIPEESQGEHVEADRALLDGEGKQVYEARLKNADGSVVETMFYKAGYQGSDGKQSGIVGIALDISARKAAERRVASLNRVLMVLSEINQLIIYTRDRTKLLEETRRILQETGKFSTVWIRVRHEDRSVILADDAMRDYVVRIFGELENPKRRCWPEKRLHCRTLACCNVNLSRELHALGLESLIHLPLRYGDIEWGEIGILGAVEQTFSKEEQSLLEQLAGNLSFALDALRQEELRRSAESELALSARVFENSSEGIVITDASLRMVLVNKAFTTVTGYAADEVIGNTPAMLGSTRQPPGFFRKMWRTLQKQGEWHGEVVNRRKNGEDFPEWLTISQVRNEAGEISNYVAVFADLTARRKSEERVEFLANFDSLTALPNRNHFNNRLATVLAESKEQGKRLAVIYFDIDRFKLINETIGHHAADRLLIDVSTRLLGETRSNLDVARLGGDQFALLIPSMDTVAQATQTVLRIQESLRAPFTHGDSDQEIHMSASIGISVFPEDGDDAETLVRNADSAMYKAIEEGGNAYRFFRQEMNERAAERVQLESRLYHALERGELSVFFQPFVATETGSIVGAEALLRWKCPELGGYISPATFIPLLEETGLIRSVGEWVLGHACAEAARWQQITGEQLFVAVNISALQLTDDLPHLVAKAIALHNIAPAQLEIELTESAIMRDADHGIRMLHELKALGVRLSIDDFGTGYSSLSYLKRLPMSTLKIDRSFVMDIPDDSEAISIARAILALGHSLHLDIIAEGVESVAQAEFLCHNGCDLLQGYHFSKPVNADDFLSLLIERPRYHLPQDSSRNLQLLSGKRLHG